MTRPRRLVVLSAVAVAGSAAASAPTPEPARTAARVERAPSYAARPPSEPDAILLSETVRARWPRLEVDATLSRAAESAARVWSGPDAGPIPGAVLGDLLQAAGAVDPTGTAVVVSTTEDDPSDLLEALAGAAEGATHVGVARLATGTPRPLYRWAAVAVDRRLHLLRPVPTAVTPDTAVELRFRLAAGLATPEVVATTPSGDTVRPEPVLDGPREWRARIPPATATGELHIQVLARGESGGPTVVATMPILVSSGPPSRRRHLVVDLPGQTTAPSAADAALALELVNRFRIGHGRPALVANPVLERIALEHAADLAVSGVLTHRTERTGGLADRLRGAGYRARAARENLARADTVTAAQRSLQRSPSHRANLLADDVDEIGIGVVGAEGVSGGLETVVVQVLASPVRVPPVADVRAFALALLPTTATHPSLDAAAAALAARPDLQAASSEALFADLRSRLRDGTERWRTLAFEIRIAGETGDLTGPRSADLLDAEAVGVGAAVVDPGDGPAEIRVVYVGGTPG